MMLLPENRFCVCVRVVCKRSDAICAPIDNLFKPRTPIEGNNNPRKIHCETVEVVACCAS